MMEARTKQSGQSLQSSAAPAGSSAGEQAGAKASGNGGAMLDAELLNRLYYYMLKCRLLEETCPSAVPAG